MNKLAMKVMPHGIPVIAISAVLLVASCTQSGNTVTILQDPNYIGRSFKQILVISADADYDSRADFEREMVAKISAAGGSAIAYHSITGNTSRPTRDELANVLKTSSCDAILVTRIKNLSLDASVQSGTTTTKATVIGGSLYDSFRYDYRSLTGPDMINLRNKVTLSSEMFSAADDKKIWVTETTTDSKDSEAEVIGSETSAIVDQLIRDQLIGN